MSSTNYLGEELQHSVNRFAGTLNANGEPTLDAQGAANVWAGTQNLELLGALNTVNGSWGLGLNLVCDQIMGSTLDAQGALASGTGTGEMFGRGGWGNGPWG